MHNLHSCTLPIDSVISFSIYQCVFFTGIRVSGVVYRMESPLWATWIDLEYVYLTTCGMLSRNFIPTRYEKVMIIATVLIVGHVYFYMNMKNTDFVEFSILGCHEGRDINRKRYAGSLFAISAIYLCWKKKAAQQRFAKTERGRTISSCSRKTWNGKVCVHGKRHIKYANYLECGDVGTAKKRRNVYT